MKTVKALVVIFLSLFLLSFESCLSVANLYGTKYEYSYELTGAHVKTPNVFDDGLIYAVFSVGEKALSFRIKNLSNDPMRIYWDDASLVIHGESKRVMHKGVKYTDRNNPQAPTMIPGKASIDDLALPTDNVYYRQGHYSQYASVAGGWEERDLFPTYDLNKDETKQVILSLKGRTFKFFLPIEQNGQSTNYTFEFLIRDVAPVVSK